MANIESTLRYYVPDEDKPIFETLITEKNVNQAPNGTDDDWFIINFAFQNKTYIITNDHYKQYKLDHPEYREFINIYTIWYTCLG